MVGAHSSMPDTFDGDGILAQTKIRGVRRSGVDPGSDHKSTRMVRTREEVYLPLYRPEGLNVRTSPSFCAFSFVVSMIREQKKAEWMRVLA